MALCFNGNVILAPMIAEAHCASRGCDADIMEDEEAALPITARRANEPARR